MKVDATKQFAENARKQMIRYHRLVFPEQKVDWNPVPQTKQIKEMKKTLNSIYKSVESDVENKLYDFLKDFRV